MKRAVLERLAAVLVLAACICAECIPLLLALVALTAMRRNWRGAGGCGGPVRGARKVTSACEFAQKREAAGAANTERPKEKS